MRRNAGIIGPKQRPSKTDSSACKVHDLHDVHTYKRQGSWPQAISFDVNTVVNNSVDEGQAAEFQIRDPYNASGTVYWAIQFMNSTNSSDFSATSGSVSLTGSTVSIFISVLLQDPSENVETFYLEYRTGSTSGPIFATSPVVSINNIVGVSFPVSGQGQYVQWEIWSDQAPATFSSGTYYNFPSPWVDTSLTETNWKSDYNVNIDTYTNSSGITQKILRMPGDSDMTTQSNTSDGQQCVNNGGYTLWFAWEPSWATTSWGRPFQYQGFASGAANFNSAQPSSTSQYHGPLIFINGGRSDVHLRRPSGNSSGGGYAYTSSGSGTQGSGRLFIGVFTQNLSNGTAYFNGWNGVRSTGVGNSYSTTMNFTYNSTYGVKTAANAARPFFADSAYWGSAVNPLRLMTAGMINNTLTSTERTTLVNYIKTKYA